MSQTFHADELRAWIAENGLTIAPGSADRVMRLLRQRCRLNYEIVSRRGSLYRALAIDSQQPAPPCGQTLVANGKRH